VSSFEPTKYSAEQKSKKLNLQEVAAAVGGTYVEAEATSGNKNRIPDLLRKYKFEDDDEFNFKLRISSDAYVGVNFRLGNKIELEYFYDMKSHPTEGGFSMDRRKFTEEI